MSRQHLLGLEVAINDHAKQQNSDDQIEHLANAAPPLVRA